MPAIVGTVNVNSVSGVFNIGDVGNIAPSNFSKTYAGGGSFNSGEKLTIHNASTTINVYESEAFEQTPLQGEFDGPRKEQTA